MERSSDHGNLATALAEARPAPRKAFAQDLDERVAAGFPGRSRLSGALLRRLSDGVREISPQRLLLVGGAAALAGIVIATVIVASLGSSPEHLAFDEGQPKAERPHGHAQPSAPTREASGQSSSAAGAGRGASEVQYGTALPSSGAIAHGAAGSETQSATTKLVPFSRRVHREIERSAEIGLLAAPADIADDSAQVFSAVHDANGIVLHSTTTAGRHAGARFDLLIPSARLGDALAAFSAIDEVRSRHEATADITPPTVTVTERLGDSRAKIDGLLAQLSAAKTQSESETIEGELRGERRRAADLRSQLSGLNRRADFSRVSLKIETGSAETGPGGAWGIDDAFGDTGHILGVAAGVTLVGLAVITPLALLCLLAWFAHRLLLRARRERALDA
jgi:hypothetical protein